jgi:hypothetical protein
MKTSTIEQYVKQKNEWNAIFGNKALTLNTTSDRQRIADMLESDLSPENLTCDGELSHTQVQARYKQLTTAAKQLIELDPSVRQYIYEMI